MLHYPIRSPVSSIITENEVLENLKVSKFAFTFMKEKAQMCADCRTRGSRNALFRKRARVSPMEGGQCRGTSPVASVPPGRLELMGPGVEAPKCRQLFPHLLFSRAEVVSNPRQSMSQNRVHFLLIAGQEQNRWKLRRLKWPVKLSNSEHSSLF